MDTLLSAKHEEHLVKLFLGKVELRVQYWIGRESSFSINKVILGKCY